jgi:hypothetical protein
VVPLVPAVVAPPPPEPLLVTVELPPSVPCAGVVGGVLPVPPSLQVALQLPPPEPPSRPFAGPLLPPPPPAEVIELKIEFEPVAPGLLVGEPTAPPAPTVIGKPVAVTVILLPGVGYP